MANMHMGQMSGSQKFVYLFQLSLFMTHMLLPLSILRVLYQKFFVSFIMLSVCSVFFLGFSYITSVSLPKYPKIYKKKFASPKEEGRCYRPSQSNLVKVKLLACRLIVLLATLRYINAAGLAPVSSCLEALLCQKMTNQPLHVT